MRKILSIIGVFILISTSIFACGSKNIQSNSINSGSLNWLIGDWYSAEWNVTYTFIENNNIWTIQDEEEKIAQNLTIDTNAQDKKIVFVSDDGTKYIIDKKDDTHIIFQQEAKEGYMGLTNSVDFAKK